MFLSVKVVRGISFRCLVYRLYLESTEAAGDKESRSFVKRRKLSGLLATLERAAIPIVCIGKVSMNTLLGANWAKCSAELGEYPRC